MGALFYMFHSQKIEEKNACLVLLVVSGEEYSVPPCPRKWPYAGAFTQIKKRANLLSVFICIGPVLWLSATLLHISITLALVQICVV